jgi:hypothetical protein
MRPRIRPRARPGLIRDAAAVAALAVFVLWRFGFRACGIA